MRFGVRRDYFAFIVLSNYLRGECFASDMGSSFRRASFSHAEH